MSTRRLIMYVTASGLVAAVCFIVLAVLPAPKVGYLKDPLRGILVGLGMAGVGIPISIAGSIVASRFESSPYFEGRFIAGFLSLVGYICISIAVVCTGLASYAFISRYLKT